jgi:aspartyl-tRNA(Asn)/glutamyl-tRNA(Gln) amidotransferase subunit A
MAPTFPGLSALAEHYRSRALTPPEVVGEALARLRDSEPRLNAFAATVEQAEALRRARESAARWAAGAPLGPLDGVPVTVKDTLLALGWPTLRGSRTVDPAQLSTEDAPAVAKLRAQGAIIIGKTTTPEFGWKAVTDSPLCGVTCNPWDASLTPGGSSGGAAAALAAGIGYAALGTDAGGSIRIPAAFCGLVGLKPSRGRIANYPPSAVGSLGHVGLLTRYVDDAALLLDAVGGPDARDALSLPAGETVFATRAPASLKRWRVAYSETLGYARVEPEIAEIAASAARRFEELGAHVELLPAPFDDPTEVFLTHFLVGLRHSLRGLTPQARLLLDPGLREVLEQAEGVSLEDYLAAVDRRTALARTCRALHQKYDVLLTPATAVAPFAVGRNAPDGYKNWLEWTPFTYPFNLTGQPAVSMPCGTTRAGLPVGLQIVGEIYQDAKVLQAARAYAAAASGASIPPKTKAFVWDNISS